MESFISFEMERPGIDEQLNFLVGAVDNVVNNISKLIEKFEELLKVLTSGRFLPNSFKNQISNTNTPTPNKTDDYAKIKDCIEHPTVGGLDDIAGLTSIKNMLYTLVILPRHQPQLFQNRAICRSILLYGPPGTGKTKLVHALAAEAGSILHTISMGNLLSSYVGETEKNLKNVFNYLRTSEQLSILFIDEIDGICRKRTSSEHEYSRRIKTELMCQMTKISNCSNTVIIAATNCPWDLDSAILRRFQKRLYVSLPNNEEILELFQMFTKDIHIIQTPEQSYELIQRCQGYSGSDISSLVHDALDIPLTELQSTTLWNMTSNGFYEPVTPEHISLTNIQDISVCLELKDLPPSTVRARPVTVEDFLEAAKHIQVTVTAEDIQKYDEFRMNK